MIEQRDFRIRNRATILALLPIVFILWTVGWFLYRLGSENKTRGKHIAAQNDSIEIVAVPFGQHEEAARG